MIAGLVHPGAMGAALGGALVAAGHEVVWASEGRSAATRERAARFRDVGTVAALAREADVVLSVCPPHAALDVARQVGEIDGVYVDANAVSPMTARAIGALHRRFVDGGIIGGPPSPRLCLSGDEAAAIAALFDGSPLAARVVTDASALKMVYAAWSKGTTALLLATRDTARQLGVERELLEEWADSAPDTLERLPRAERSAAEKGWRWAGEMDEIAATFAAAGRPEGFHRAAGEVFRS